MQRRRSALGAMAALLIFDAQLETRSFASVRNRSPGQQRRRNSVLVLHWHSNASGAKSLLSALVAGRDGVGAGPAVAARRPNTDSTPSFCMRGSGPPSNALGWRAAQTAVSEAAGPLATKTVSVSTAICLPPPMLSWDGRLDPWALAISLTCSQSPWTTLKTYCFLA
jgi:hypothetical protein